MTTSCRRPRIASPKTNLQRARVRARRGRYSLNSQGFRRARNPQGMMLGLRPNRSRAARIGASVAPWREAPAEDGRSEAAEVRQMRYWTLFGVERALFDRAHKPDPRGRESRRRNAALA